MRSQKLFDRAEAGRQLATQLTHQHWSQAGWVIALPRGGVPVGYEIAQRLQWSLDIWLVRKLGVPQQPELAMGAIAVPNTQILNQPLIEQLSITPEQVQAVVDAEVTELQRRDRRYRQGQPLPKVENLPVIVVDDGLATGATLRAAIAAIRQYHPSHLTVAVPVGALETCQQMAPLVDDVVCLKTPTSMGSISQWYVHFEPVEDDTVMALLQNEGGS